jgi:ribokinase
LGKDGAILGGRDRIRHVPAFPMKAIDTTGAGDAFIGSFATFLSQGIAEEDAIRRANLYAGLSTLKMGTQKSFLNRDEFDRQWSDRSGSEIQA